MTGFPGPLSSDETRAGAAGVCSRYDSEADGTNVWVHLEGQCVARFGRIAYEVWSTDSPPEGLATVPRADAEAWLTFVAMVERVHGYTVPERMVPIRLRDELDIGPFDVESTFLIKLDTLAKLFNPFREDLWGRGLVTVDRVDEAVACGDLIHEFVPMGSRHMLGSDFDVGRIAHFVVNPDPTPIQIDVGQDGGCAFEDGLHRLAAAMVRGETHVQVTLAGFVDAWDRHFADRIPVDPVDDPEAGFGWR